MNPFVYPKSQHTRAFTPKQYKRYQSYKRLLRLEFSGKCVYCQMPSSMRGFNAFGVDHYRPRKYFPLLSTDYGNLYYCCNACNSAKGSYWPDTVGKEALESLPNPCDHVVFRHLKFKGAVVEAKSRAGEIAVSLLDLNDPEAVTFREFVIDTVAAYQEKKVVLQGQRLKVGKKQKLGLIVPALAAQAYTDIDAELEKVELHLKRLSGDPS